mgnify:CR=1 FL=1
MSFWEYIGYKAVTLCFLGIGTLTLVVFMMVSGVDGRVTGMAVGLLLLIILFWLTGNYLWDRSRIRKLKKLIQDLPDGYLLGEVLPPPANVMEKAYFSVIQVVSRCAVGMTEQAIRDKEDYCSYVESWVHEIKTPLTACSLIIANGGDIRKLKRELKRADNLTENILYYARMRTADRDRQIRKMSAAAVMNEAVRSQMELLTAAGVSVDIEGDFTVYSDEKAVAFMLRQMLVNAAKYCPGCHIEMKADRGIISVKDNGIGIPSHELRRVTERGFTGTNGRKLGAGTGMGLYIVRELCQKMGIVLSVDSVQGMYTCLSLNFGDLTIS